MIIPNNNRVIKGTTQRVYINSALSNLISCEHVNQTSASFSVPSLRFDDNYKKQIQDKLVTVYAGDDIVFAGFIDTTNAQLSTSSDSFTVGAKSIYERLNHIYVGFSESKSFVTYSKSDNWTLKKILQDLFNKLDSYGSLFDLGNISILDETDYEYGEDIVFRDSYISAIDQILEYAGDVTISLSYSFNRVTINLYRAGSTNNPVSYATLGSYDDAIYSNVQDISIEDSGEESPDQITLYGCNKKYIITVFGAIPEAGEGEEQYELPQLIPAWDQGIEEAILKNPERNKRGSIGYLPGAEYVYQRYKLPTSLHRVTKLDKLPIVKNVTIDGDKKQKEFYKLQAFVWDNSDVEYNADTQIGTGILSLTPRIVDAEFDGKTNTVIFKQPTTRISTIEKLESGVLKKTYVPCTIGITIGIESDKSLFYRTTSHKSYPKNENIQREDFEFIQYTNINAPIEGVVFDRVLIFYEDTNTIADTSEAVVLKDDTGKLSKIANDLLRDKKNRLKTVNITIPYITKHYKIGNRLIIDGENSADRGDIYTISDVSFDLENYKTIVQADNKKPLDKTLLGG